ncbi:MAG: hypothetical protein Q7V31_12120 [Parvibaculum sp.]|uniref:hypothetical protein n=1 Tax=Parvibaculum sp. TaxID=2024848 RepID=UPI00271A05B6|nr:hypothetical protein [Parvibaculum sp.]MDO8839663.1 hypothetical protein [Parvibaculum sp.]
MGGQIITDELFVQLPPPVIRNRPHPDGNRRTRRVAASKARHAAPGALDAHNDRLADAAIERDHLEQLHPTKGNRMRSFKALTADAGVISLRGMWALFASNGLASVTRSRH